MGGKSVRSSYVNLGRLVAAMYRRDCVMTEARPSVRCSVDSFAVGICAAFSPSGVGVGRLGDVPGVQAQRRQENRVAFYRFPGSVPV